MGDDQGYQDYQSPPPAYGGSQDPASNYQDSQNPAPPVQSAAGGPTAGPAARPSSKKFWDQYTSVNYVTIPPVDNQKVWDLIAGRIGEAYGSPPNAVASNSCATRVSYALNRSGYLIPSIAGVAGTNPHSTRYDSGNKQPGDDYRYIVSAEKLDTHLKSTNPWGPPDFAAVAAVKDLQSIISGLKPDQCAIFATPNPPGGHGHSGVLKQGYQDPFVEFELPVDVWLLPLP